MTQGLRRRIATAAALVFMIASSRPSRAELTKDQCVEANAKAQELRSEGRFSAARDALIQCTDASCPALVRDDCTRRLDDIDKAQPSVVFHVKDRRGTDLMAVRVSVDGKLLVENLDGRALRLDPGVHTVTFEVAGQPAASVQLLLREGETGRHEHVEIGGPASKPQEGTTSTTLPASPPPPDAGLSKRKVVGLSLAGAGVLGLGLGTVFGLLATSSWNDAKSACGGDPGHCTDVDKARPSRDTAQTDSTISTIGFVAGGVFLAAGAVVYWTDRSPRSEPMASIQIAPAFGPHVAGLALKGTLP